MFRVAGSCGRCMINFLTNCQTVFPSGCSVSIPGSSVHEVQFPHIPADAHAAGLLTSAILHEW